MLEVIASLIMRTTFDIDEKSMGAHVDLADNNALLDAMNTN